MVSQKLQKMRSPRIEEQGKTPMSQKTDAPAAFKSWICLLCGFIYSEEDGMPAEGIAPGTAWADVPQTWMCPECGTSKAEFEMTEL